MRQRRRRGGLEAGRCGLEARAAWIWGLALALGLVGGAFGSGRAEPRGPQPLKLAPLIVNPDRARALRRLRAASPNPARQGVRWIALRAGHLRFRPEGATRTTRVFVNDFELSAGEATVGQYMACVEAGSCAAPLPLGPFCRWGEGQARRPINCVSFEQARAFAAWMGARLPTELEWVYAARSQGLDLPYPGGEAAPTCAHAAAAGCAPPGPLPPCQRAAGRTAQGACDLLGNVSEWVEAAPATLGGASPSHLHIAPAVCGGGFLDEITSLAPRCRSGALEPISPQRGLRLVRPRR